MQNDKCDEAPPELATFPPPIIQIFWLLSSKQKIWRNLCKISPIPSPKVLPPRERERVNTRASKLTISIIASTLLISTHLVSSDTPTKSPDTNTTASFGDSKITTSTSGISLIKSDKESSQSLNILPSANGMNSKYSFTQNGYYQIDIGTFYESNKAKNDTVLDASYRVLYAGASMGTYIGVTKGSNLEKFILSQGFALEGGRFKLSAALLQRLTELDFSEYSKTYKEKLSQKSLGAEYSKVMSDKLLNEIKTSITYYSLDGKQLGTISDVIIDNATLYDWTRVSGGYRGGKKILAEVGAVFRLNDSIRATLTAGVDRLTYEAMYDVSSQSSTKLAGSASILYRINDYHQIEASANSQNSMRNIGAKYSHDFGNAFGGYISLMKLYRQYAPDDTQYRFGLNYTFGGDDNRHTRLAPLFASVAPKATMSLAELTPIASINSDNFAISPKKTIYSEHMARVNKTVLGAGDGITVASDGTLSNIYFDNGGFTVTSVDNANDSTYLPYLGIVGGKLAVINISALNTHMASQGLTTGQTKTLNVSVSDSSGTGISLYSITITKGSVQIGASVQKAYNATTVQRAAFLAGTMTIAQVNSANGSSNHAPTASDFTYSTAVAHSAQTFSWLTLSSAADSDGDTMSATVQTQGSKGTAVVSSNNITYTPTANKSGSDTVVVRISDGNGGTKDITVTLNSIDTTIAVKTGNIVTDYATGLQWMDAAYTSGEAAAYSANTEAGYVKSWGNAGSYCSALTLDGVSGWRLPALTELEGIVDTGNSPTIKSGFANTASGAYWSSTEYDSSYAWVVGFYDGGSYWGGYKSGSNYIRCVK